MKYVEASTFGGPEVLEVLEKETPSPGAGMLLVEVQAAGVNYADVAARLGHYPAVSKAPFVVGFEIAGIVREVGKGVEGLKIGDPVAALTVAGGGYASHILIPAAEAMPIPRQLDPAVAAAVLLQGLTAYLLLERAQVQKGETIAVVAAAGGVGGLLVQLAKLRGATVIGLASESKFESVKSLGADYVFDYGKPGWANEVAKATQAQEAIGTQGVQVFLDSIGDLATEAFPLLSPFGRWVVYGVRGGNQNSLPAAALSPMIQKNISLLGFSLGGNLQHIPRVLPELFKYAVDGRLRVAITKYPLAEARAVHTLFEGRKTSGKLILVP
jgi:NADPH:quinone reductase